MPESKPSKLYFCADKPLKKCVASCTFVATKQPAAIALRGWVVKRRRSASHSFPLGLSVFL